MNKGKIISSILVALLICSFSFMLSICYALEYFADDKGMAFLMELNIKRLVNWSIDSPSFNVYVDQKLWKSYTQKEKERFCRHVYNAVNYLYIRRHKVESFSIFDMTSGEKYAKGRKGEGWKVIE
jgi:hypothetical protein